MSPAEAPPDIPQGNSRDAPPPPDAPPADIELSPLPDELSPEVLQDHLLDLLMHAARSQFQQALRTPGTPRGLPLSIPVAVEYTPTAIDRRIGTRLCATARFTFAPAKTDGVLPYFSKSGSPADSLSRLSVVIQDIHIRYQDGTPLSHSAGLVPEETDFFLRPDQQQQQ